MSVTNFPLNVTSGTFSHLHFKANYARNNTDNNKDNYNEQHRLSLKDAKRVDLVDNLDKLGSKLEKITNNNSWYSLPLRDEKTAAFRVSRKINAWYEFGPGRGGTSSI